MNTLDVFVSYEKAEEFAKTVLSMSEDVREYVFKGLEQHDIESATFARELVDHYKTHGSILKGGNKNAENERSAT